MQTHNVYDVVGIGFGPANLALAIAAEEADSGLRMRFVERQQTPSWQSAMLLDGSDIQNHPLRDLVSLRNPRSRYSFTNFLHEHGRLLEHLNLPLEFPLRKEYAQYIGWAAGFFGHLVDYGTEVSSIAVRTADEGSPMYQVSTLSGEALFGRSIVLAPGRSPYIPEPFVGLESSRVFHLTRYLPSLRLLGDSHPQNVAVIGGSQSAVELTLDLMRRYPRARITMYVRSFALRLKDTSPFSEEGYFPGFTARYHALPRARKDELDAYLRPTNYSASDGDVLAELYAHIYEQRIDQGQRVFVRGSREVLDASESGDAVRLRVGDLDTQETEEVDHDLVVLATGFRDLGPGPHQDRVPPLLQGLADRFAFDNDGYALVEADYTLASLSPETPPAILNGLCESSHGIGDAGSFSLLSLRAQSILEGLHKRLDR
ncbi:MULTISPECIES: SidA/IucD/PvdA family monooxygenase [Streptacidiphilus]|uniref:L-lysine N6-monooxygenase MbtG n=1 Tax=Streptacidiphilus cavernicola TaxID=3342716 RepID=A0ABV6UX78_9ACTN|nr:SidA/IucD/PvdA family monooxygenase [Streptacidiphilus jeojiense]